VSDYVYYIYNPAKSFGSVPDLRHRDDLAGLEGFSSVYSITLESAQAIHAERTAKGFKGCVWSERLWLDFDSYEAANRAGQKLEEMGYDFVCYDTGNRGMHFGILRSAHPSHLLPSRDKKWVKEHFPEADLSIYTHLHLLRLPSTVHEATGRRKEFVEHVKGEALVLPERTEDESIYIGPLSDTVSDGGSIFDSLRIMGNTVPQTNGNRHPTLVKLAYALKEKGVAPDIAHWWLSETNKLFEEPKEIEAIEQIVRSIYK